MKDLIEKRRRHVQSCKENNDNSHQLIADLYSDPSHFIYEIIQNAEDAEATNIMFSLSEKFLKITHNGKLFTIDNVDAITTIGSSTKAHDVNKIGKFGAGFKSVFAITNTPEIHSGIFNFKIADFIVPEEIKPVSSNNDTVIIIPFNHSKRNTSVSFEIVRGKLEGLEPESILFLTHISKIEWQTIENKGHYSKNTSDTDHRNAKWVSIFSHKNELVETKEYLVFEKTIQIENKNLKIELSYNINSNADKQKIIVPFNNSKLSVYFPTNERTGLNFLLQAPYKTTPNRETIPFDDEQNKKITDSLSEVVAESLSVLKKLRFLNVDFFNTILPIQNNSNHVLYRSIYNSVKNKLLSDESLLPTHDNNYTQANQALLARGKVLTEILARDDIQQLFKRENWLSTDITYDKTRNLRDYLTKELGIEEIDFEHFAKSITTEFLSQKLDEWMAMFYSRLIDQEALYRKKTDGKEGGILRKKPIIRLIDNSHICPYGENGRLQVYFPSSIGSSFKIVKKVFADNENSKIFLEKLGLKEPDRIAEIKEHILPKYSNDGKINIQDNEHCEDLKIILEVYKNSNDQGQIELIDILKDLEIIKITKSTEHSEYKKGHEVYFPNNNLKKWFEGNSKIYFFSEDIYNLLKQDNYFEKLFKRLEVREEPRMEGDESYGSEDFWDTKRGNYARGLNNFNPNFSIEGLEHALGYIHFQRSLYLWRILLEKTNRLAGKIEWSSAKYFKGARRGIIDESSNCLKLLINKNWLYDKEMNLLKKSTSEIALDDLHDDYLRKHANINDLVKVLRLKLSEIKVIEEKTGGKFLIGKELEDFKQWQAEKVKEETKEKWEPEISSDKMIGAEITEFKPSNSLSPDLSGQSSKNSVNENTDNDIADSTKLIQQIESRNISRSKHSKEIGDWGELFVKISLEQKYQDELKLELLKEFSEYAGPFTSSISIHQGMYNIVWLNQKGNIGIGYDFVIIKDEAEIEYIEVKSKTSEQPELIEITGTQWEWARKLFEQGNGDKYQIYIVSNAGTYYAKIHALKNPIKLWKEGKLKAHMVNLEI